MKGIIFNLLEDVVVEEHGDAAWDRILSAAALEGAFTSLGNYPDEHFRALLAACERELGGNGADILRWFARRALPRLALKYPQFFAGHESTRDFLLTLNDVIHPEVRKLYPGADVPWFDFESRSREQIRIGYRSPRKLCAFAEGLIEGSAAHFGETVTIEQPTCMLRGDDRCMLVCTFVPESQ